MSIVEQLEKVTEQMCQHYCKYPDTWDEEKEGCELSESKICEECPLSQLV